MNLEHEATVWWLEPEPRNYAEFYRQDDEEQLTDELSREPIQEEGDQCQS